MKMACKKVRINGRHSPPVSINGVFVSNVFPIEPKRKMVHDRPQQYCISRAGKIPHMGPIHSPNCLQDIHKTSLRCGFPFFFSLAHGRNHFNGSQEWLPYRCEITLSISDTESVQWISSTKNTFLSKNTKSFRHLQFRKHANSESVIDGHLIPTRLLLHIGNK